MSNYIEYLAVQTYKKHTKRFKILDTVTTIEGLRDTALAKVVSKIENESKWNHGWTCYWLWVSMLKNNVCMIGSPFHILRSYRDFKDSKYWYCTEKVLTWVKIERAVKCE